MPGLSGDELCGAETERSTHAFDVVCLWTPVLVLFPECVSQDTRLSLRIRNFYKHMEVSTHFRLIAEGLPRWRVVADAVVVVSCSSLARCCDHGVRKENPE